MAVPCGGCCAGRDRWVPSVPESVCPNSRVLATRREGCITFPRSQQPANFVLHLHHLADQQIAIAQRAPPFANGRGGHVTLRQKITPQAVTDLAGVDVIVFLFCRCDGSQHQWMPHLQGGCVRQQVIVDPTSKNRGFHGCGPRLWKCSHPAVQIKTCRGNRTLGVNLCTAILHAITNRPLVTSLPDVLHS